VPPTVELTSVLREQSRKPRVVYLAERAQLVDRVLDLPRPAPRTRETRPDLGRRPLAPVQVRKREAQRVVGHRNRR
jgi:hypothetical protein